MYLNSEITVNMLKPPSPKKKFAQGLLILNSYHKQKSQKKTSFLTWKFNTHEGLYSLWKDTLKSESNLSEFEVILKVLYKRKAEVDEMWGMIKIQEEKLCELVKRNQFLEVKNKEIQGQIAEFSDKSIQVNFLQDSMLRRTYGELEQFEKSLFVKESQLASLESHLSEKAEKLTMREKDLHQKQVNSLSFHSILSQEAFENELSLCRSEIFPEYIEDNLWLQIVDPSIVTGKQLQQLQEYEKLLSIRYEELVRQKYQIIKDVQWVSWMKEDLDNRELKIIGVEAIKEENERMKEELKKKYEEIVVATEEVQVLQMRNQGRTGRKGQSSAVCKWKLNGNYGNIEESESENLEYLKIGLEELAELQKKGVVEENLTDVIIENLIRFGESLMQREKDFQKEYQFKTLHLESCKLEVDDLKKMLKLEESLCPEAKSLENHLQVISFTEKKIENLEVFKETLFEKHLSSLDRQIMEIQQEEMKIKQYQFENESAHFQKLNKELQEKVSEYNIKIFEIKSVLKLISNAKPGNFEIFKQEISRILMKHEVNPESSSRFKLIMTVYLWLNRSYSQSHGKHHLLVKVSFYLLRLRVIMLKQGFSVAPVSFSLPNECMWLEVFWLRAKHQYFQDFYMRPELVTLTKNWFVKFITGKLAFAFEIMTISRTRMLRNAFYKVQNKCIQKDKKKTQNLYSQIMKVQEKNVVEIRKDVNVGALCSILPFFERFNKFWRITQKVHILKWRNYSARVENVYYQHTIGEIYTLLSELMHKEHKFRQECTQNQSILRIKLLENTRLLDKILF